MEALATKVGFEFVVDEARDGYYGPEFDEAFFRVRLDAAVAHGGRRFAAWSRGTRGPSPLGPRPLRPGSERPYASSSRLRTRKASSAGENGFSMSATPSSWLRGPIASPG